MDFLAGLDGVELDSVEGGVSVAFEDNLGVDMGRRGSGGICLLLDAGVGVS